MRWAQAALAALCVSALVAVVRGQGPIAPHLAVLVQPRSETVIALTGYDTMGERLRAFVTSLPERGTLYHLSQVFSDYGYDPKLGVPVKVGDMVTGSANRVIYVPPAQHKPVGKWASFTYIVKNIYDDASRLGGIVSLVGSDRVLVGSDFLLGPEDWTVVGNGARGGHVHYDPSGRGPLNHFVYGVDEEVFADPTSGNDRTMWFFSAPAKFMGNRAIAYGGKLELWLASAAGDFAPANLHTTEAAVVLECATCAAHRGIRLAYKISSLPTPFTGSPLRLSLTLSEAGGWVKDPNNSLLQWQPPTQCEMVEVLEGLTSLRVLGDWTKWYESVAVDDVRVTHGPGVPIPCYDVL